MSNYSHKIKDGQKVKLKELSTKASDGIEKKEALELTEQLGQELEELLDLLFYAGTHSLLVVLQGMDTSGKDGTIRHLLTHSNAQSLMVWPFKVPTPLELDHDFLWRCHAVTPAKGNISIFNRSHYEDVLVVRVHDLAPEEVWKNRYDHINAFENLLADSNTIILKFFLHISKSEQEERLLAREQEVEKAWKLSVGDWKEREHWEEYQEAYEDVLNKSSKDHAPWHVVPADEKWFRNLAVTKDLVEALKPYKESWMSKLEAIGVEAKADLAAMRESK